jgi:hypothetical protein
MVVLEVMADTFPLFRGAGGRGVVADAIDAANIGNRPMAAVFATCRPLRVLRQQALAAVRRIGYLAVTAAVFGLNAEVGCGASSEIAGYGIAQSACCAVFLLSTARSIRQLQR